MIKGIYLREEPTMGRFSETDVLKEFDPLNECWSNEMSGTSYDMQEKEFTSENFLIKSYTFSTEGSCDNFYDIYRLIMYAEPNLLKVIKYTPNTVVIAFPLFCEDTQEILSDVIYELSRISTFILKSFPDVDIIELSEYLGDYIDMCISWENKK